MPKNHPSPDQLKVLIAQLQKPYGAVYLKVDGYLICAEVSQQKMTLKIIVYVNGWTKGAWTWHGKESELDNMTEIAKRFYCLSKKSLYSGKQLKAWVKFYGGEKKAREKGIFEKRCFASFIFSSANSFINHIKKNNQSIEVIDYTDYKQQLDTLNLETS